MPRRSLISCCPPSLMCRTVARRGLPNRTLAAVKVSAMWPGSRELNISTRNSMTSTGASLSGLTDLTSLSVRTPAMRGLSLILWGPKYCFTGSDFLLFKYSESQCQGRLGVPLAHLSSPQRLQPFDVLEVLHVKGRNLP